MSAERKKRKRRFLKPVECVLLLLFFAVFLHSLIYAIDCSISAGNMDACLADAYEGRCVEASRVMIRGRFASTTEWLFLKLDNGKKVAAPLEQLEKAGMDVETLEGLHGQKVRLSYTTTIRPYPYVHYLVGIIYHDTYLMRLDAMQSLVCSEATGFYVVAGLELFLVLLFSLPLFSDTLLNYCWKKKHQEIQRRKAEKKQEEREKWEHNKQLLKKQRR